MPEEKNIYCAIGELVGRVGGIEEVLRQNTDILNALVKTSAKTEEIHRITIQHDKRICGLEQECKARAGVLKRFEHHEANDTPAHVYLGERALKGWCVVFGAAAMWLLDKLPKIVELLK